jgi:carboxypeptidase D
METTAPQPPPPASEFYVPLHTIPHFHALPSTAPLHIWSGHLLAEPDNFIPPGPNETPHPNLPVQSHLFFVLLKARRTADRERTIFWFNGGPGCSSFDGLMMEVGPWRMDENGELWQIEGGWEEYANVVYSRSSQALPCPYTHYGLQSTNQSGLAFHTAARTSTLQSSLMSHSPLQFT